MSKKTIDELHSAIQDGKVVAKKEKPYLKSDDAHDIVIALADGKWVDAECLCKALHLTFAQAAKAFDTRVKPESKDCIYTGPQDMMIRLRPEVKP